MFEGDLVSVVVPCYNPTAFLRETIASLAVQTHPNIEIIVVNDGTDRPESMEFLKEAAGQVDLYLEQPNRGLAAARNAGFHASKGWFLLPLDADDLVQPTYVAECLAAFKRDDTAAFVYTDYQVFGTKKYSEHPGEYNLYRLLDRNYFAYASLIRRSAWEDAGGYDESMRLGYEDWEFWLRLGSRGCFGHYLPRILFHYRKHGTSLYDTALAHHDELVSYIQNRHPELYQGQGRVHVKAQWQPAVCMIGRKDRQPQTIQDVFEADGGDVPSLAASCASRSGARAVLISGSADLDPTTAEMAALAVWSGNDSVRLPDGSVALSRRAAIAGKIFAEAPLPDVPPAASPPLGRVHRHLLNAELLTWRSWILHPFRSLVRLIPLRMKERVNQSLGTALFDLSFYLQFQPKAVALDFGLVELLEYCPAPPEGRQRLAVVVPHLGSGGAESVLLDILASLDRERFEVLVLATQSKDDAWASRWKSCAAHVYDLAKVVSSEKMVSAICSFVKNWQCQTVLVQNSLYGYAALPHVKRMQPDVRTIDVIHAIDKIWDQVSASGGAAAPIDVRVAVSDAVQKRLLAGGIPAQQIRLIRGGVDLERFRPGPTRASGALRILFAGRLDPVKRPELLVEIAAELLKRPGHRPFRFVVAGDGPELIRLRERVKNKQMETMFDFLGQVEDLAPVFQASDIVILPSRSEGVPLVLLEALACARPVIASRVGGIPQLIDTRCGILVDVSSGDASDFALALDSLLSDPERRKKMGREGRKRVEAGYDLRTVRAEYAEILEQEPKPQAP